MAQLPPPRRIEASVEQLQEVKEALKEPAKLTGFQCQVAQGCVDVVIWLVLFLKLPGASIRVLRKIFGVTKEPASPSELEGEANTNDSHPPSEGKALHNEKYQDEEAAPSSKKPSKKGGRLGKKDYQTTQTITIAHPTLKAGDPCPLSCSGWLYLLAPATFIRIVGTPLLSALAYELERLRCSACGAIFKGLPDGHSHICSAIPEAISEEGQPPDLIVSPGDVNEDGLKETDPQLIASSSAWRKGLQPREAFPDKYDERAKALLAICRYYLGLPFKRLDTFQKMMGVPFPDSTQWDLIEGLINVLAPLYFHLEYLAAQGYRIHHDDTGVKIISLLQENKQLSEKERCGMHTTALVSFVKDDQGHVHEIHLFYSSRQHAGENFDQLLEKREAGQGDVIKVSDALAANHSKQGGVLENFCNAHAIRSFQEAHAYWPEECDYVLKRMGWIYEIDHMATQFQMSDAERLTHHQLFSAPIAQDLKTWLDKQVKTNQLESESSLGKAIGYMRRYWAQLTLYLRVEGAVLDNNIDERSAKVFIRQRKNSLFFKNELGASIASMLSSLIYTCFQSGHNAYEWLVALQENASALKAHPQDWLPWSYQATLRAQEDGGSRARQS